jgi:tRNA-2-methylthio-N6-dimethylallyladenosine synthase
MNVRDSEHIIAELNDKENYVLTDTLAEADLILVNTCSVREKPVSKLFSEIGKYNLQKKEGAKIGVCGCTASHLGKEIFRRAPYVNFVIGARNVSKISTAVNTEKFLSVETDYDESTYAFGEYRNSLYKAYVNISIGCDKKCTYCIVPHTRGEEISIPPELIIQEARKAALKGAKEIFLLGQNVNNYGRRFSGGNNQKYDFSDLLNAVSEIPEVKRIRFTSPHPLHMDDKFLETFANNPKVCKSMHMPLQSGSTHILEEMKRGYSKEWFLNRALKLRAMVPDVSISTDIIVAFPGESEADFEDSLDVMRQVKFEQVFAFKYSPRPLTKAAEFTNQVDSEVASERLERLQLIQDGILDEISESRRDKIYPVYIDELRNSGFLAGRTDNNALVQIQGDESLLGQTVNIKITNPKRLSLYGEIVL